MPCVRVPSLSSSLDVTALRGRGRGDPSLSNALVIVSTDNNDDALRWGGKFECLMLVVRTGTYPKCRAVERAGEIAVDETKG